MGFGRGVRLGSGDSHVLSLLLVMVGSRKMNSAYKTSTVCKPTTVARHTCTHNFRSQLMLVGAVFVAGK